MTSKGTDLRPSRIDSILGRLTKPERADLNAERADLVIKGPKGEEF